MMRKMNSFITASQSNLNARAHCEKYLTEFKKLIEFDNVLNPPSSCQKGVRNKRFKSIVEKKYDQVKRRTSKKMAMNDVACSTSTPQAFFIWFDASSYFKIFSITLPTFNIPSTAPHVQQLGDQGAFPMLSSQLTYYFDPSNGMVIDIEKVSLSLFSLAAALIPSLFLFCLFDYLTRPSTWVVLLCHVLLLHSAVQPFLSLSYIFV
ncbi:hypothetical protein Cgig2_006311 [Carnegiea gigantea]|uniref:Uncharacterized protein n=1 Tax=Carnegiea gigantea TaxID=171969 RepID=A0A9Q1GI10_9CARY|nr:hypothetical protein Cgig2_032136 [Carnegiea gigantea]KAJ8422341.1 hypothetical protein Cgig2_006311 [Carnegiea gigantea]